MNQTDYQTNLTKRSQTSLLKEEVSNTIEKWNDFLNDLEAKKEQSVSTALRSVKLVKVDNESKLKLIAPSKLSYDLLQDVLEDARLLAKDYFKYELDFTIEMKKVNSEEEPILKRFEDLAKVYPVVRYLIDEFGIEPTY